MRTTLPPLNLLCAGLLGFAMTLVFTSMPVEAKTDLAAPDGKPADMSKKVKVFIVMGQSNTLEMGKVAGGEGSLDHAVKEEKLYPFLVDDEGNWTVRKDVRNVSVMTSRKGIYRNEWLTVDGKRRIGIEQGIGHQLGAALDEPVMVLKSSIGNRSLGWDLLPPGTESWEDGGKMNPGYGLRLEEGKPVKPAPGKWYAGKQYDDDVANAKKILNDLQKYYPEAKGYEVAGFFWWQGDKDRYNAAHSKRYEQHLVNLIKALRKDFDAPDAKFVCATLGQTSKDSTHANEKLILEAKMAVDGKSGKYPEFKGNVGTVYTHPLSMGSGSNGHYGNNAKTYMNVGLAMGEEMVKLLK